MATKIKVKGSSEFNKELSKLLKDYGEEVLDEVTIATKRIAEDGAAKMRSINQPPASSSGTTKPMTRKQWNKYSKSWDAQVEIGTNFAHATIHNKKYYRLTHLLEYGHVVKNQYGQYGTTRAFKHIEPVEQEINILYEDEIKKALGG